MDSVYMNSRSETVIPIHIFKELNPSAIQKSVDKPYPRKLKKSQRRRSHRAGK